MKNNWKQISDIAVKTFLSPYEDECIYVIKIGHDDEYCAVYDDAHEIRTGQTFVGTKEEVENEFGIVI